MALTSIYAICKDCFVAHEERKPDELPLGARLRQLRNDQGRSLRDVEREHGINSGYLSQIERGGNAKPSPGVLLKLATAYDVPSSVLMKWAGYVEDGQPALKPNQIRALKYLGDDPSDEEVEAIKAILSVLRKGSER